MACGMSPSMSSSGRTMPPTMLMPAAVPLSYADSTRPSPVRDARPPHSACSSPPPVAVRPTCQRS
ncbi:unannotated protein [freshwater metagenome]|uniref:Unannotated protein n=1 Tax=freshwater metagenome TaxID=449393 RepID=A0A6J7JWV9_9ZZZZ